MESVKVCRMKTVGPTTNRKNTSSPAAIALPLDSHLMPFSMPLMAERMKHTVSTAMTVMAAPRPPPSIPNTAPRPPVICRAPRPSEVAVPKTVANSEMMSMVRPGPPRIRLPSSGRKQELIRLPSPLR